MKKKFTVVGFYDSTGQRIVDHITADTARDAAVLVAKSEGDVVVVAVFEGELNDAFCSGECIDYAEDLIALDSGRE